MKIKIFSLVCLALFANVSQAYKLSESAELHGFISQGYIYSPDNYFSGKDSNTGSFNFREFGLNAFWEASQKLRFAGQLLSRTQDESADGSLKIDFLLADYKVYQSVDSDFGVRIGRTKNAFGLYNETRDIPSARTSISVPNAIYFNSFRDVVLATDGLNVYGQHIINSGSLSWNAFTGGRQNDSPELEYYMFGQQIEGAYDPLALKGLKLEYLPNSKHNLKFAFSLLDVNATLEDAQSVTAANSALSSSSPVTDAAAYAIGVLGYTYGDSDFNSYVGAAAQNEAKNNYTAYLTASELNSLFVVLSMQYGVGDWLFSAEYMDIYTRLMSEVLGNKTIVHATSSGFALQVEWFTSWDTQLFARYEELYFIDNDRSGLVSARPNDAYHGFGKGISLGAKWYLDESWALTGEVAINKGTAWLPVYAGIENTKMSEHWSTYSLNVSYQF